MTSDMRPESETLFNMIIEKYGDILNDMQLKAVKESVDELVENAEALRKIKLDSRDEPFSVFTPYIDEQDGTYDT
ncbi:MAG: hypothetical protein CL749_08270 [Chloroflexi bacterium]|jgi:hypothetical protein|nr:hypothetical protein [Chloroflexota bacterium]MDP7627298.1 hypothetical protein [SAR202 cluster bacterium]PKB65464.1 MAG: hypothetical protein BZY82_08655 [SAR202 cluster bacterium Io17-Chloro-G3]HAE33604.1 hypothetical protein [Dehalococcoidia bacterium]MBG91727.1 hypothetical protein [Chloroflexota bacterium]|tara:strand:- start:929 stop:1153 length:225 start_codon:yes stop_codon:yes gene_type:complete